MILTEDITDLRYQIRAYQPGRIDINGTGYQQSLILTPQQLITDWLPQSLTELKPEDSSQIISFHPKLVLLGVGVRFQMPNPNLLAPLRQHQISIESMDTGAACRTFIALTAEGRQVCAALLIR